MNNFSSPKISPSVRWRTPCHLAHHRAHERKTRRTGRPHRSLPEPAEARRPDRGPYAPQDEVGFRGADRRAGADRLALDLLALIHAVRASTRPGLLPVGFPSRQTTAPLTITVSMPFARWMGFAKLAVSSISLSSNTTISAAKPGFRTPRSARPKVFAVSPVIL